MTLIRWFIKYSMSIPQPQDASIAEKLERVGIHKTEDLLFKQSLHDLSEKSKVPIEVGTD